MAEKTLTEKWVDLLKNNKVFAVIFALCAVIGIVAPAYKSVRELWPPVTKPVSSTCSSLRGIPGNEWKIACNANTAAGYYWEVLNWAGPYGFYGLVPIGGDPLCISEKDIGTVAHTAAWRDTTPAEGYWPVAGDFCRPKSDKSSACAPLDQGSILSMSSTPHTGKYRVICRKSS